MPLRSKELAGASLALVLIAVGAPACHRTTDPSPERCVISGPPAAGIPRLYRQANWRKLTLSPFQAPLCTEEQPRALEDECESVDDLGALLGNGVACGPAGPSIQHVCPSFGARITETPPAVVNRPCGTAACPNRQVVIQESSGSSIRVHFYDDPACHAPAPDPKCGAAAHACYYRVLSVTTELAGDET